MRVEQTDNLKVDGKVNRNLHLKIQRQKPWDMHAGSHVLESCSTSLMFCSAFPSKRREDFW